MAHVCHQKQQGGQNHTSIDCPAGTVKKSLLRQGDEWRRCNQTNRMPPERQSEAMIRKKLQQEHMRLVHSVEQTEATEDLRGSLPAPAAAPAPTRSRPRELVGRLKRRI